MTTNAKKPEIPEDIGMRVRARRFYHSMGQADLAKETGLSVETISRIESGKNVPRFSTIRKLAKVLDVPASYFTEPKK